MKRAYIMLAVSVFLVTSSLPVASQQQEIRPIPIVTGYTGFNATFEPNKQTLNPTLNPIFLVPLGRRFLVEAEFEMESDIEREDGVWGPKVLKKNVEYLQLDYFASRYLTVVVGRFLTPFGMFNERLHPNWIKNLQETPIIFGMSHGSSTGGQLRGGIPLGRKVDLNYAAYFSTLSTTKLLEAERSAGGRWSLFFPKERFEAGFSFNRRLGPERFNAYGFDATWNARRIPLEVRSEYARSELGSGYWIEGAYRLNRVPRWRGFFRRSQTVVRVEQFFAPAHVEEPVGEAPMESAKSFARQARFSARIKARGFDAADAMTEGHGDEMLPDQDTQRVFVGWNYYLREELKVSFAYGRSFSREQDRNIWSIGIAYRFLYW